MSDDDSSELSSVLSSIPSDDELQLTKKDGILKFFSKAPPPSAKPKEESPPLRKREPSPPHEYVLADNPDIAFIVMFRSRFTDAFPKSLPNFGPQELERDVVDAVPGHHAEQFLCALLGLLLNRKQDVKSGHYNRALEEAIQSHKSQWAKDWEGKNPLLGGATFETMIPTQRLTLLRTLILWSLSSSDAVKGMMQSNYKGSRHEDDLNQPLSVQPWGNDSYRRRYYLIEGLDDTHFRVYRESDHTGIKRSWWSVANDIDELKSLADKLMTEDGQLSRKLAGKMLAAVPRFEGTEEKRKRREYRQARKQQFKRPEPGFSMYEGRTRGKRTKYTYSDEEDEGLYSDATSNRRSTRNTRNHSPAESVGPTVTLSGRQVKSRQGGTYGETLLSGAPAAAVGGFDGTSEEPMTDDGAGGRPRRAAATANGWGAKGGRHIEGYNNVDEMTSDEEDDASEQDYGDDEEEDEHISLASDIDDPDELSEVEGDVEMDEGVKKSMIVKLPVKTPTPERKTTIKTPLSSESVAPNGNHGHSTQTTQSDTSTVSTKETPNPKPSLAEIQISPHPFGIPAKAMNIGSPQQPPLSPKLAFRGSPEKPPTPIAKVVNVGFGES